MTGRLAVSASNRVRLEWARDRLQSIPHDSPVLIIAPARTAADDFIRWSCANGSGRLGVHRFTLAQLAHELAGVNLRRAGGFAMEALAVRSVWALSRENLLGYFRPVADTPGYAGALVKTLVELRASEIDVAALGKTGLPGSDLAKLLARFSRDLQERELADDAATFHSAAGQKDHSLRGVPLLLLDLPAPAVCERRLLESLLTGAPAVYATACLGNFEAINSFSELLQAEPEFLDMNQAAGQSLDRVRQFIFSPGSPEQRPADATVEFFSAAGEGLECVEIARRILALAATGIPFDRMAILLRNPFDYLPLVEDALRRAGIPAWYTRDSGRPDPRGRAFLALLECAAAGLTASRFAEYLSLGQSPEQVGAPAGWERMLVDAAVIGGRDRWQRRLAGLQNEFQLRLSDLGRDDDAARSHIERQIERLQRLRGFALPIIGFLDSLPRRAPWGEWIESLARLAHEALRDPEPVLELLDELRPLSEVGPVELDEVRAVLAERLRFLQREPPDNRFGCVFVCTIPEAAARTFDVVFLPGLAEGVFPRKTAEDPLLLDDYRRMLSPELLTGDTRVARERLLLRYAAGAANSKLVVSYPRIDVIQGRPRVPSFYALEILRAAEGRLPDLREIEIRAASGAPSRLGWPAPALQNDAIDDAEYDLAVLEPLRRRSAEENRGRARFLVDANPHLGRSLRARWRRWKPEWSGADGLVSPDIATRHLLSGRRLRQHAYSASSLQHFAACPYRFLLHAIHHLRPREEKASLERMDPLTRGAIFHRAQFRLFRELQRVDLLPVQENRLKETLDISDIILNQLAAEQREELAPAIERVWASEIESLRADLHAWLRELAEMRSPWRPRHFELAFGLDSEECDPASTPQDVILLDGFHLRGSIDLVEAHATLRGFRVIDHKTGRPPEPAPVAVGGGEVLQPLLYALAAEQMLGGPVQSSVLYYCTHRGDYTLHPVYVGEDARAAIGEVLTTIDLALEKGFLPAAPRRKACEFCDYRPVCGPYEEERTGRKEQASLEPLFHLRQIQ